MQLSLCLKGEGGPNRVDWRHRPIISLIQLKCLVSSELRRKPVHHADYGSCSSLFPFAVGFGDHKKAGK